MIKLVVIPDGNWNLIVAASGTSPISAASDSLFRSICDCLSRVLDNSMAASSSAACALVVILMIMLKIVIMVEALPFFFQPLLLLLLCLFTYTSLAISLFSLPVFTNNNGNSRNNYVIVIATVTDPAFLLVEQTLLFVESLVFALLSQYLYKY